MATKSIAEMNAWELLNAYIDEPNDLIEVNTPIKIAYRALPENERLAALERLNDEHRAQVNIYREEHGLPVR